MSARKTHSFTATISGIDPFADDFEDRLFAAGCDDATVSVAGGVVRASFDRLAPTFDDAVKSATHDLSRAGASIDQIEDAELNALADARSGGPSARVTLDDL